MSAVRPHEESLLSDVERVLRRLMPTGDDSAVWRYDVLEGVASRLGDWDLKAYRSFATEEHVLSAPTALDAADDVLAPLLATSVPPSLALSSLSRPELAHIERRRVGSFYTDYRLAEYLAGQLSDRLTADSTVIDPASGSGVLLAAIVLAVCGENPKKRSRLVGHGIAAADLSAEALRGARLAVASTTRDLAAVESFSERLSVQDSLLAPGLNGQREATFDAVVANPPWEKLKLTRHEFLKSNGVDRHYGADYRGPSMPSALADERELIARYAAELTRRYPSSSLGELDLYKPFLELAIRLTRDGGQVGFVIPAGLIRSKGTRALRELLFDGAAEIRMTVFENRARFFAIDTRFKFLVLQAAMGRSAKRAFWLAHAHGVDGHVEETGRALIPPGSLRRVRNDLTVPEVRDPEEWKLFQRLHESGETLGESARWRPQVVREIDMTLDRSRFLRKARKDALPVIEGRMVHQFRVGAKSYRSGSGRAAVWDLNPPGASTIEPQFWFPADELRPMVEARTTLSRVGFCDVTGQTNERTLLAAMIPSGVVCGNKVPTIMFDTEENVSCLWLACANSFVVDWIARRVVTTTMNFFMLLSLPFPRTSLRSARGRQLSRLARDVMSLDTNTSVDLWELGQKRAEIDVAVACEYGLTFDDFQVVLRDFPLLDRGQPSLPNEARSTITRDVVLATAAEMMGGRTDEHRVRAAAARERGALPYVPADYSGFGNRRARAIPGRSVGT